MPPGAASLQREQYQLGDGGSVRGSGFISAAAQAQRRSSVFMRSFTPKKDCSDQTFHKDDAFLVSMTTHSDFSGPGSRSRTAHAYSRRLNPEASVGLSMAAALLRELGALRLPNLRIWATQTLRVLPPSCIHTSASLDISRKWEKKNKIVYPPQLPGEPRRPAEIYHCRRQIKYSKDKMWYLAKMIRGMSIDQALAQLEFNDKKGAQIIKEVLLEAQDMAVRDHNVEFRSNLHIAESTSGRGQCLKRIRYHGRGRFGIMEKVYCHYFVKLVEGPPPPPEVPKTAVDHAKDYIQQLRSRTIIHTL